MPIYNLDNQEDRNQYAGGSVPVKVSWQKCYDIESEIDYLGEENPGEHYFKITRKEIESFWYPEEDECYLLLHEGNIDFEGYSSHPSIEERDAMYKILKEKNIL